MTDDNWKRSKNTIGAIGETYAQSMFLANGFAVYVPIVDNQGIDFLAVKNNEYFKIQVKTVQPYSYCCIRKNENTGFEVTDDKFLVCYIRLVDLSLKIKPETYIFKASDWSDIKKSGLQSVLTDYRKRKKNPEYGILYNKRKGNDVLKRYSAENFFYQIDKKKKSNIL